MVFRDLYAVHMAYTDIKTNFALFFSLSFWQAAAALKILYSALKMLPGARLLQWALYSNPAICMTIIMRSQGTHTRKRLATPSLIIAARPAAPTNAHTPWLNRWFSLRPFKSKFINSTRFLGINFVGTQPFRWSRVDHPALFYGYDNFTWNACLCLTQKHRFVFDRICCYENWWIVIGFIRHFCTCRVILNHLNYTPCLDLAFWSCVINFQISCMHWINYR